VDGVDAEAVAEWSVGQYEDSAYPAVVLGSPHGAAVHLAVAIGAPWLPTSFPVTLAGAHRMFVTADDVVEQGQLAGREILSRNSGVDVRQVHDPMRHGARYAGDLVFHLRWRRLPGPYLRFLRQRLRPGGAIILITDDGTCRDHAEGPVTTQFGSMSDGLTWPQYRDSVTIWLPDLLAYVDHHAWQPADAENATQPGLERDLRGHGEQAGHPVVTIGYDEPSSLSAAVADCTRQWLRAHDKTGNRLAWSAGGCWIPSTSGGPGWSPTGARARPRSRWTRPSCGSPAASRSPPSRCSPSHPDTTGPGWRRSTSGCCWPGSARDGDRSATGSPGLPGRTTCHHRCQRDPGRRAVRPADGAHRRCRGVARPDGRPGHEFMKLVGMESGDTAAEGTPPESRSPTALGRFDRTGRAGPRG
jgi:hypothetical protein